LNYLASLRKRHPCLVKEELFVFASFLLVEISHTAIYLADGIKLSINIKGKLVDSDGMKLHELTLMV